MFPNKAVFVFLVAITTLSFNHAIQGIDGGCLVLNLASPAVTCRAFRFTPTDVCNATFKHICNQTCRFLTMVFFTIKALAGATTSPENHRDYTRMFDVLKNLTPETQSGAVDHQALDITASSSFEEDTDAEESNGYVIQKMLEAVKKNPQILVLIKETLSGKTSGSASEIDGNNVHRNLQTTGQNVNPNSQPSGPGNPYQQPTGPYINPYYQPYGYPIQQSIPPYPLPGPYGIYSQPPLPRRESFEESLQDYPLLELFNNLHKKKNDVLIKLKQAIFQHPSYRRE